MSVIGRFGHAFLFLVVAGLVSTSASVRAQADAAAATATIQSLSDKVLEILRDKSLDEQLRETRFHDLLVDGVDISRVSRFVLSHHWRRATDEQKREYRQLFEDYVVKTYSNRLKDYSDATIEINRTDTRDGQAIVSTVLQQPGNPQPVNLDWRLRENEEGEFKIIDVVIEGVSMAISQRSEFNAYIQRNGGSIDALIQRMRQVVQSGSGAAGL